MKRRRMAAGFGRYDFRLDALRITTGPRRGTWKPRTTLRAQLFRGR